MAWSGGVGTVDGSKGLIGQRAIPDSRWGTYRNWRGRNEDEGFYWVGSGVGGAVALGGWIGGVGK